MVLVLGLAVLLGAGLSAGAARAETCPESCVFDFCSTLARRDTTLLACYPEWACKQGWASYDLPAGRVAVQVTGSADNDINPRALARDHFRVVGPPTATPVEFSVRLHLLGQVAADPWFGGWIAGSLRHAQDAPLEAYVQVSWDSWYETLNRTLSVGLTYPVGQTFEITYSASAMTGGPGNNASLTGTLSFAGLPPGYGIVSCQGFTSGTPVSNRPRSWGGLKHLYR